MNLPIELLVILAMIGFALFFQTVMFITKKIKLWRYKPENDKGRIAEESRRRELTVIQRPVLSERRNVLQTTDISSPRQNSTSNRKSSFQLFTRRRR